MTTSSTDILIVGAGPTGLMLGLELASQRIPFRIIDASVKPSDKSRALVLHSRTLELLARHGIAESFVCKGVYNEAMQVFANGKFVLEVDLKRTRFRDTAFPYPLAISQAETEEVLEDTLRSGRVVLLVHRQLATTRTCEHSVRVVSCNVQSSKKGHQRSNLFPSPEW